MFFRWFAKPLMMLPLFYSGDAFCETLEGKWLTEPKTGIVEIFKCDGQIVCGRLVWLRIARTDNNPYALDLRNPEQSLRNRSLCGLPIMWGFHSTGLNQWSGGYIYDPETGNTYTGKMELKPNGTLALRGYVVVSLFGRTQSWVRFTQTVPACPSE